MSEYRFIKVGSYWTLPLWKKIYLNLKYWMKGLLMFIRCIIDYDTSIKDNELTVLDAWGLCFSIQEMRMGKMYKMGELK